MKSQKFNLALITGASSGIGEALCHLLANQGIDLLITGRDASRLTLIAEELRKKVRVTAFNADLTLSEGRQRVIQKVEAYSPDLVINNAGFGLYGDALSYQVKDQLDILTVNCNAVLEITLESARLLISENRKGVIMNISSVASFYVFPGLAVYAAAKSLITQVSQSLDLEMQSKGIRVLVSCPGMVETNFSRRASGNVHLKSSVTAMTAESAAQAIWQQIQSGTPCQIIDWKSSLSLYLSYLIPKRWLAKILRTYVVDRLPK